ncbi:recombinase [Streptococcus uberis]|uniref:ERF family protein n=1 Tax=Streptococcus uberis TaxID=1349 RepID=UPI0012B50818|nr:ERF family protein [Streptococcus uberis]MCK1225998.1 ERF family protein [Streptococcus uberis]MTB78851.1 recombinase [Streptococcus uberis]
MVESNVYQKLTEVQNELSVPKTQYNSFGNFHYRTAEDIKNAVKPYLLAKGLNLVVNSKVLFVHDGWVYQEATAVLTDVVTLDRIEVTAAARESESKAKMDLSQMSGSANSYASKYALGGMFLLDDNADADTDAYHNQQIEKPKNKQKYQQQAPQNNQQQEPLIDNSQFNVIDGKIGVLAGLKSVPSEQISSFVLKKYNISDFRQIPISGFDLVNNYLDGQIQKARGKR